MLGRGSRGDIHEEIYGKEAHPAGVEMVEGHRLRGQIVPGKRGRGGPVGQGSARTPASIPRTSDSCGFQAALEVRG
jgi:hypothetical protein